MVYYQKYRPQSLDELVGQSTVKSTLLKAFQENRLSHAYLFCGPRGTGKTSTARILAKMVNCESQQLAISDKLSDKTNKEANSSKLTAQSPIPCNSCPSCLSITDGSNLDLIEIDAASNRGIDDIRTLRDNVKLSPSSAKKKVYIIDEVHMLSNEAFNALLKTLEEPPSHVMFILATTEVHKIPVTILSRVQKLEFSLASVSDLITAMQRVVAGEGIDIEDEALRQIAKAAEGSYRDCIKVLDQLASKGEKITVEMVETALNSGNFADLRSLLQSLADQNSQQILQQTNQINERGLNLKDYTLNLLELTRYLFLIQNESGDYVKEQVGPARFQALKTIAEAFSSDRLILTIKLIQEALEKMKTTSLPIFALEVALVQACQDSQQPRANSYQLENTSNPPIVVFDQRETTPAEQLAEIADLKTESSPLESLPTKTAQPEILHEEIKVITQEPTLSGSDDIILRDKWNYILETIRGYNFSLEALLKAVSLKSCDGKTVMIEVPYSFHQRIIESPKNRELLESVMSDVLSKPVKITTIIGSRPINIDDVQNVDLAADDEIIRVAAEIFTSESINIDSPQAS